MVNITPEEHVTLERLAEAMLDAVDMMCDANVPLMDSAVAHCAEGHAAIMQLLYPDRKPQ